MGRTNKFLFEVFMASDNYREFVDNVKKMTVNTEAIGKFLQNRKMDTLEEYWNDMVKRHRKKEV